jgi:hypothetical protein
VSVRAASRLTGGYTSRKFVEEYVAVIDLFGLVLFATVVGIGLLDVKSGIGPFAMYRSPMVTGVGRRAPMSKRRGDDNQPNPPAPAR